MRWKIYWKLYDKYYNTVDGVQYVVKFYKPTDSIILIPLLIPLLYIVDLCTTVKGREVILYTADYNSCGNIVEHLVKEYEKDLQRKQRIKTTEN